ncbi:MAG: helix-hairpin-helix domain-containing protein [Marinilabiliaceae bacterium]|nr:helix-hairpin-helix domain-containing protein [Marinilabiliaceae bacterium]
MSRVEQLGFATMFLIIIGSLLLYHFFSLEASLPNKEICIEWLEQVRVLEKETVANKNKAQQKKLFRFDPNRVSIKEMELLGLKSYVILNILKYREAGGGFWSVGDFKSVYGLDSVTFVMLQPFVAIGDEKKINKYRTKKRSYLVDLNRVDQAWLSEEGVNSEVINEIITKQSDYYFSRRVDKDSLVEFSIDEWKLFSASVLSVKYDKKKEEFEHFEIELNRADTSELCLLKGIGPYYARRIIYYRNQVGGFYSIDQLLEVEGISPIVLSDNEEKIVVDPNLIQSLNVHTASLWKMKAHPYLNFYMAKDIYEYRRVNGNFKVLSEVFSLPAFEGQDTIRLSRYLTL